MQIEFFKIQILSGVLVLGFAQILFAQEYVRDYSPHSGYVSSVEDEKTDTGTEIAFINKPETTSGVPIKDKIFNSKLSREFQNRYEDQFGRTEAERVYNSPNKDTYYEDLIMLNGTPQQVDDQKRAFGNYMIARLVEYHTDNYLKSDSTVRPFYEAKERFSNVKVEVQNVKVDVKYDLPSNTIGLNAKSTVFNTKVTLGKSQRLISLTRSQNSTLSFEARYLMLDQKIAAIITKRLNKYLSTSFTASTCTGDSNISTRETLYLTGLSLGF